MCTSLGSIARGSSLLVVSQYVAVAIGFVATVIAARLLGPRDFGLVALVIAYPELIQSALAVKSSSITTRYLVLMRAGRRTDELAAVCKVGFGIDVGASLIVFGVVLATAGVATDYVSGPGRPTGLAWLTVLYAASLPIAALDPTSMAVLTSAQRFGWIAALQVAESTLRLGLIVALGEFGFGVGGVVAAAALSTVMAALGRVLAATVALRREGVANWLRVPVGRVKWLRREFAGMAGWNYVLVTLGGVMTQVPLLWLGRVRGPEEAGLFRLALSMVTAVLYAETALGRVVSPILILAVTGETAQRVRALAVRWMINLGLPLAGAIALGLTCLPWLIPLMFGDRFATGVPSVQIMLVSAIVSALVFWVPPLYYAAGRIDLMTGIYACSVVGGLAAAWWAISQFGLAGMAVVFGGTRILFTLALVVMAGKVAERRDASDRDAVRQRLRPAARDLAGVS
jgi:O-antigen/teichoic acid export membrane protein